MASSPPSHTATGNRAGVGEASGSRASSGRRRLRRKSSTSGANVVGTGATPEAVWLSLPDISVPREDGSLPVSAKSPACSPGFAMHMDALRRAASPDIETQMNLLRGALASPSQSSGGRHSNASVQTTLHDPRSANSPTAASSTDLHAISLQGDAPTPDLEGRMTELRQSLISPSEVYSRRHSVATGGDGFPTAPDSDHSAQRSEPEGNMSPSVSSAADGPRSRHRGDDDTPDIEYHMGALRQSLFSPSIAPALRDGGMPVARSGEPGPISGVEVHADSPATFAAPSIDDLISPSTDVVGRQSRMPSANGAVVMHQATDAREPMLQVMGAHSNAGQSPAWIQLDGLDGDPDVSSGKSSPPSAHYTVAHASTPSPLVESLKPLSNGRQRSRSRGGISPVTSGTAQRTAGAADRSTFANLEGFGQAYVEQSFEIGMKPLEQSPSDAPSRGSVDFIQPEQEGPVWESSVCEREVAMMVEASGQTHVLSAGAAHSTEARDGRDAWVEVVERAAKPGVFCAAIQNQMHGKAVEVVQHPAHSHNQPAVEAGPASEAHAGRPDMAAAEHQHTHQEPSGLAASEDRTRVTAKPQRKRKETSSEVVRTAASGGTRSAQRKSTLIATEHKGVSREASRVGAAEAPLVAAAADVVMKFDLGVQIATRSSIASSSHREQKPPDSNSQKGEETSANTTAGRRTRRSGIHGFPGCEPVGRPLSPLQKMNKDSASLLLRRRPGVSNKRRATPSDSEAAVVMAPVGVPALVPLAFEEQAAAQRADASERPSSNQDPEVGNKGGEPGSSSPAKVHADDAVAPEQQPQNDGPATPHGLSPPLGIEAGSLSSRHNPDGTDCVAASPVQQDPADDPAAGAPGCNLIDSESARQTLPSIIENEVGSMSSKGYPDGAVGVQASPLHNNPADALTGGAPGLNLASSEPERQVLSPFAEDEVGSLSSMHDRDETACVRVSPLRTGPADALRRGAPGAKKLGHEMQAEEAAASPAQRPSVVPRLPTSGRTAAETVASLQVALQELAACPQSPDIFYFAFPALIEKGMVEEAICQEMLRQIHANGISDQALAELEVVAQEDRVSYAVRGTPKAMTELRKIIGKPVSVFGVHGEEQMVGLLHQAVTDGGAENADAATRLLAARCLIEGLRIFWPVPPLDVDQLQIALRLHLHELDSLAESPSEERLLLLEKIVQIQSFNLLHECEDHDALIVELVTTCLRVARARRDPAVSGLLFNVLMHVLVEVDEIPYAAVRALVIELIPGVRDSHVKEFTRRVLANLAEHSVVVNFNDFLNLELYSKRPKTNKTEAAELTSDFFEAVYELYTIDSALVSRVLPNLEADMKSTDSIRRDAATGLVGRLLAYHPSLGLLTSARLPLVATHPVLFDRFVERMADAVEKIRLTALKCAGAIFRTAVDLRGNEAADTFGSADKMQPATIQAAAELLRSHFHDRRVDPSEDVRLQTIEIAADIASTEPGFNLLGPILPDVFNRVLDKKSRVREAGAARAAGLYALHGLPAWTTGNHHRALTLAWAPQLLCEAYVWYSQRKLGHTAKLEELIEQDVLGCGALTEATQRALAFLGFYTSVAKHEIAMTGLRNLLSRKFDARASLWQFLQLRTENSRPLVDSAVSSEALVFAPKRDEAKAIQAEAIFVVLGKLSPAIEEPNATLELAKAPLQSLDASRNVDLYSVLKRLCAPAPALTTEDMGPIMEQLDTILRLDSDSILPQLAPLLRRAILTTWLLPDQVEVLLNIWHGDPIEEIPAESHAFYKAAEPEFCAIFG